MEQRVGGGDIAFSRIVVGSALGVALLHLYASLNPSAGNWGFHHPAFLPSVWSIGLPLLMGLMAFERVQRLLLDLVNRCADRFGRLSLWSRRAVLLSGGGLAAGVFWLGRERLFLLGDGSLLVRLVPFIRSAQDPHFFRHEPLPSFLAGKLWQLLDAAGILPSDAFPIQLLSITAGVCSLFVLAALVRRLAGQPVERLLTFGFILVSGSTELFFGYVENYAPLCLGMLIFLSWTLSYFHNRVPLILPSIAFGLLLTLHFGMLYMLPAYGLLMVTALRKERVGTVILALAGCVAVVVLLLWMCGYSAGIVSDVLSKGGEHLLPLLQRADRSLSPPILSVPHLLDVLNLLLLLSPLAPAVLLAAVLSGRGHRLLEGIARKFLLIVAVCGTGFLVVTNLELGMSRDWDLVATFGLGLIVIASVAMLSAVSDSALRRRIFIVAIGVTAVHTLGWVMVNGAEARALARFKVLPDSRFWSGTAMAAAYEELGVFYRGREDAVNAVESLTKALRCDSTNDRIMASIANIYHLRRDAENEQRFEELAVSRGTRYWDVYVNLGSIYASQGRTAEALRMTLRGLALNPRSALANNNVGSLMLRGGSDCRDALPYFLQAIDLDPNFSDAYHNAGLCYYQLRNFEAMKRCLERFIRLRPDRQTPEIRALLETGR